MIQSYASDLTRRILLGMTALLVASLFMYMGLVLSVIADTAARADAGKAAASRTASIAGLESRYLRLSEGLTRELALAAGFVEPTDVSRISADAGVSTLSLRAR